MKRYTFDEIARRECAECTTTITTTKVDRYITYADHLADREALLAVLRRAVEAMEAVLVMWKSPEPRKFDENLSWRNNDLKAEKMATAAIAACREKLEEQE